MFVRLLTPLITNIFNNADALPVYRDMRIVKTYKLSTEALDKGANIVILPECPDEFNEITKNAIHKGLDNPRPININLVNAQQTRRVVDRLVGYRVSPIATIP